jgi:hypothetical protein
MCQGVRSDRARPPVVAATRSRVRHRHEVEQLKRFRLDRFGHFVFELFGPTQRVLDALDLELPGGDLAGRLSEPCWV